MTDDTGQSARRPMIGRIDDRTLARAGTSRTELDVVVGILEVMRAMSVRLETVAASMDVNGQTMLALLQLDEPWSQKRIAESLGCDPSYVTSIVDRLEELGAAERVPSTEDRRVKLVTLTDAGHRLREEAAVRLLESVPAVQGLDASETDRFAALLATVVAANADVLGEPDPWNVGDGRA